MLLVFVKVSTASIAALVLVKAVRVEQHIPGVEWEHEGEAENQKEENEEGGEKVEEAGTRRVVPGLVEPSGDHFCVHVAREDQSRQTAQENPLSDAEAAQSVCQRPGDVGSGRIFCWTRTRLDLNLKRDITSE